MKEEERRYRDDYGTTLDPAEQPIVTITDTESEYLFEGDRLSFFAADRRFRFMNIMLSDRKHEKTKYRIDFTYQGEKYSYAGEQVLGAGGVSLYNHIRNYHEGKGQGEEAPKYRELVLQKDTGEERLIGEEEFKKGFAIYMGWHCILTDMERCIASPFDSKEPVTPEEAAYNSALLDYIGQKRKEVNRGSTALCKCRMKAIFCGKKI